MDNCKIVTDLRILQGDLTLYHEYLLSDKMNIDRAYNGINELKGLMLGKHNATVTAYQEAEGKLEKELALYKLLGEAQFIMYRMIEGKVVTQQAINWMERFTSLLINEEG